MTSKEALQLMDANLDIDKLISEVQVRPALWDLTKNDYCDKLKRKACWEEITEIFAVGNGLTLNDKKKLGDILHKKWKNVRDRYVKDIQDRKGKSGDGARKKAPYMYSLQLQFLRDTIMPRTTVSSLGLESPEFISVKEEREEEHRDDEEYEPQEATSASSTRSSTPNVSYTQVPQVGKRRLDPVEEKIFHSLDMYEKRLKIDKRKEKIEANSNRHFLLSLVQSLESLPQHLNTRCRIEIMQCINKYENISQQHQQPLQ